MCGSTGICCHPCRLTGPSLVVPLSSISIFLFYLTQHLILRGLSHRPGPLTPILDKPCFGPGLQTATVVFISQKEWPQQCHFYPECTVSQAQLHFPSPSSHNEQWLSQIQLSGSLPGFRLEAHLVPDITAMKSVFSQDTSPDYTISQLYGIMREVISKRNYLGTSFFKHYSKKKIFSLINSQCYLIF